MVSLQVVVAAVFDVAAFAVRPESLDDSKCSYAQLLNAHGSASVGSHLVDPPTCS